MLSPVWETLGSGWRIWGIGRGIPFWVTLRWALGFWPEVGQLAWGYMKAHCSQECRGAVLGKELCLFGEWIRREGLDCGLLPICKEPFQYFIRPLSCAGAVSSHRPRVYGQRRRDLGTEKSKPILFLMPSLWRAADAMDIKKGSLGWE